MFLASTLYHAMPTGTAKQIFRVLDHSAIYLLIAGTYTPFCLLGLGGAGGWTLFGIEWAMAAAGITLHAVNLKAVRKAEVVIYMIMGWAIVASWFKLRTQVPFESLVFLIAGGVLYSLGVIWYSQKNRPGTHVVWHVFVLAGAVCHWFAVWFLV
jgi:hemolysin III